jgi:uncharacterized delta-60 repeat protein
VLLAAPLAAAPGDPDPTFDGDGRVVTDLGGDEPIFGIAQQPDGKLVVGGYTTAGGTADCVVLRYLDDGSLDPTFGVGGVAIVDLGGGELCLGLALQPDGRIILVGRSDPGGGADAALLLRFDTNGALDPTFDLDGAATIDIGVNEILWSVAVQPDGKIVAVGSSQHAGNAQFTAVRVDATGALDPTFDGDGVVLTEVGGYDEAVAVALQPDGKIVAGGYRAVPALDSVLVRYNPDGSLDPSFDGDGIRVTDFGGSDEVRGLALQPDGAILTTGNIFGELTSDILVARYLPDGSLDPSFGLDGWVTTDFGGDEEARSIVVQPDGKIITAGRTTAEAYDFAIVRYLPDGSPDYSFNGDGRVTTDVGGDDDAWGLVLQLDGKLVAAGWTYNGNYSVALVRWLTAPSIVPEDPIDPDLLADGTKVTIVGSGQPARLTRDIVATFPAPVSAGTFSIDAGGTNPAPISVPGDTTCATVVFDPGEGPGQVVVDTDADGRLWPPDDGTEGRAALAASADPTVDYGSPAIDTANGCIDIVRSWTRSTVTEPGPLESYGFALDGVTVASTSLEAPTTLTLQQVRDIYACASEPPAVAGIDADGVLNNWAEVGGAPGRITRTLPPAGSELRAVFVASVLGGVTPGPAAGCPDVVEVPESSGAALIQGPLQGRFDEYIMPYGGSRWVFQANNAANPTLDRRGGTRPLGLVRNSALPCPTAPLAGLVADNAPAFMVRYDGAGYLLNNTFLVCATTRGGVTSEGIFDTSLAAAPGTFAAGMLGLGVAGPSINDGTVITGVSPTGDAITISPGAQGAFTDTIRIGIPVVSERNPSLTNPADAAIFPGVTEVAHVVDLRSSSYEIARALIGFQAGTDNKSPLCNGGNVGEILANGFLDLPAIPNGGAAATTCRLR